MIRARFRTSTIVVTAVFLATLVLYILVRPSTTSSPAADVVPAVVTTTAPLSTTRPSSATTTTPESTEPSTTVPVGSPPSTTPFGWRAVDHDAAGLVPDDSTVDDATPATS